MSYVVYKGTSAPERRRGFNTGDNVTVEKARLVIEMFPEATAEQRAREVACMVVECGCGHPVVDCRPEVCSHRFARDAMWGN